MNPPPKRHPAAFHCHLDAIAGNRKIPVERGHDREPCLLVAPALPFVVRLVRPVVAELRNNVGWMLNRNTEKLLHLSFPFPRSFLHSAAALNEREAFGVPSISLFF